ncbi:FAD-dependent oxidoreductase [Candidatus Woesearchaeota archaeon]|nr:FAD-dependent oxidoreductase [Candidatus Woesearchaeota archaeon]
MASKEELRNVIIIGGGMGALTAALYTARASLKPLVVSGKGLDQLSLTSEVENYPGFVKGIMGPELVKNAKEQAKRFGAELVGEDVAGIQSAKAGFEVSTQKNKFFGKTIIIATGASARKLGITGEEKFFGKGVSTCAVCDAALFQGKEVAVVGGGDSAMEESLALYKFAKKVTIIHRKNEFRASKIMQDRVLGLKDKISVIWDSEVAEVSGDKFVKGIKIKNLVKTSVDGVFAAGDVMDPRYRQAVTSAGTGCMAALEAEWWVERGK